MNYRHIYCKVISYAKSQNRHKGDGNYYERHHILPKSLFPLWAKRKSNTVLLTAREHFFCHQLLYKIFPSMEMAYALKAFTSRPNADYKISSREYERIRLEYSKLCSKEMSEWAKANRDEMRRRALIGVASRKKKASNIKVPKILRNETIERLKYYHIISGIPKSYLMNVDVECKCPICKTTYIVKLCNFIKRGKDKFTCSSCVKSEFGKQRGGINYASSKMNKHFN